MLIDVQYLQKRGKSGWRYRRKVPAELRPIIGKREFLIPLGNTEAEALRAHPKVHAEVERQLVAAKTGEAPSALPLIKTEQDAYQEARRIFREKGQPMPEFAGWEPPKTTLADAKKLYLKEKVKGNRKKELELERVFVLVAQAVDLTRSLDRIRREDAKETRDYMFDGRRSAATVDRYLNVVRAVINHAIREYDLACKNPFMGLEVEDREKAEPERRKRRPFTDTEVDKIEVRLRERASDDLIRIWRILAGTGCRLAEVTGLRLVDVHLEHTIPYMSVEWHDDRRVKTRSSRREVPLIGDALSAAQEAVEAAGNAPALFSAYCREGGPASASAALSKHVRAIISDPKVGPTHSLRHRMTDRLDIAGVQDSVRDRLLGHTEGAAREVYGGGLDAWLEIALRALIKAAADS